jgi:hypothetical protein
LKNQILGKGKFFNQILGKFFNQILGRQKLKFLNESFLDSLFEAKKVIYQRTAAAMFAIFSLWIDK